MSNFFERVMNRELNINPNAQNRLDDVKRALNDIIKAGFIGNEDEYRLLLVPVTVDMPLPLLVAVFHDVKNNAYGFHTLIIDHEDAPLYPRAESFQGNSYEVKRFAGDMYDDKLQNRVRMALSTPLGGNHDFRDGSVRVIFRDTDLNDRAMLRKLAEDVITAAMLAAHGEIDPTEGFNLTNMPPAAYVLTSEFRSSQRYPTVQGHARRTDVVYTLSERPKHMNGYNISAKPPVLGRIGGYVDFAPGQKDRLVPRFVITLIETPTPILPAELLMVGVLSAAMKNKGWVYVLLQANSPLVPNRKWRNLAALDGRLNEASFSEAVEILSAMVEPGFVISIDVDNAGDDTWKHDVFVGAANGSSKAHQTLMDASEMLTGGKFRESFRGSTQAVINEQDIIHHGRYKDQQGVSQDLREIDYLTVRTLAGAHMDDLPGNWLATHSALDIPASLRVAKRDIIDTSLLGAGVFVNAQGPRITFTADYLSALLESMVCVGFQIQMDQPPQVDRKPVYQFGQAIMGDESSGSIFRESGHVTNWQATNDRHRH